VVFHIQFWGSIVDFANGVKKVYILNYLKTRYPNGKFRLCCLYSPLRPSLPPLTLPPLLSPLSLIFPIPEPPHPFSLFSFYCFCLSASLCVRESNRSVRLTACEVHIFIAARCVHLIMANGSKWLCQAACLESGVLVLLHVKSPYSSAYSSTLRLVHTAIHGCI